MSTTCHHARLFALLLALLASASSAIGGATSMVPLPDAEVEVTEGAIVLRHGGVTLVYVDGLGWLADLVAPPPRLDDGIAWVAPAVAAALGMAPPTPAGAARAPAAGVLQGVRVAGSSELRVVLDLEGLTPDDLRSLGAVGRVEAGASLRLALPPLVPPEGLPVAAGVVGLRWELGQGGTTIELSGAAFAYEVFVLAAPTRLVIDLRPDRDGAPVPREVVEVLAPGVVYRSFRAAGSLGPSRVHLLQVAPGAGEWRVVGALGETRPTLDWAEGAFVAINGGYFEPGTRSAIGFLVVDGAWLSPPSRGRAAVGFGPDGVIIDRIETRVGVWLDGVLAVATGHELAGRIELHATTGSWAGSSRLGALLLDEDGVVVDNRVGPVRVPSGGRVVAYPAELRALALAEPGTRVRTAVAVTPASFAGVRYAVEAGPLLIQGGRDVFAPDLEAFVRGVRILDEVTQQAAIGVTADGTVLLLAAEAMVAGDLVPLLLDLGAVAAMRLDSGGSTTLVADGRVLNRNSERSVANAIVWRAEAGP